MLLYLQLGSQATLFETLSIMGIRITGAIG